MVFRILQFAIMKLGISRVNQEFQKIGKCFFGLVVFDSLIRFTRFVCRKIALSNMIKHKKAQKRRAAGTKIKICAQQIFSSVVQTQELYLLELGKQNRLQLTLSYA